MRGAPGGVRLAFTQSTETEIMKIPDYIGKLAVVPRTIQEASRLFGTKEVPGSGDSPEIMGWRDELNAAGKKISGYSGDDVPWCGLFVAIVCHRAGKEVVKDPLWARNWAEFGVKSPNPGLGDVLVFARGGAGHVGFYVGEDDGAFHVLGGNQSDQVNVTRVAKARLLACRRPIYRAMPESVKPYRLSSAGALSRNEA